MTTHTKNPQTPQPEIITSGVCGDCGINLPTDNSKYCIVDVTMMSCNICIKCSKNKILYRTCYICERLVMIDGMFDCIKCDNLICRSCSCTAFLTSEGYIPISKFSESVPSCYDRRFDNWCVYCYENESVYNCNICKVTTKLHEPKFTLECLDCKERVCPDHITKTILIQSTDIISGTFSVFCSICTNSHPPVTKKQRTK